MLIWITPDKSQLEEGEKGFVVFGFLRFFKIFWRTEASLAIASVYMSKKPKSMWVAGGKSFLLLNTSWFYLWVNETGSQIWYYFFTLQSQNNKPVVNSLV